jgi:hypothetical protein
MRKLMIAVIAVFLVGTALYAHRDKNESTCKRFGTNEKTVFQSKPHDGTENRAIGGIYNSSAKIVIDSGTYLVIDGGNYQSEGTAAVTDAGTLKLTGNLINNNTSGNPLSTTGSLLLNGSSQQQISGTSAQYGNLTLSNPNGLMMNCGAMVNGNLTLTNGDVNLNGQSITMGSSASLIESGGRVYGETGTITTTRTLGAVTNENVAGLGAEITTATSLGATTITRSHAVQSGAGNMGIQRYYDIAPETTSGLDATLVFHYDDAELYGKTESDLMLFRSADNGATWASQGGTVDTEANTITLSGIDAFSRWTASDSEHPLPVTLSEFSALFIQQPTLFWTTQSENGNAGWHVWRSGESDYGTAQQISVDLIAGAGSCTVPTEYQFTDQAVYQAGCQYYYWLESISIAGESELHGPVSLTIPQGSQQSPPTPQVYGLMQNHPNPFNPCTEISFVLPQSAHCTIDVYDIAGRKIKTLLNEPVAAKELTSVLWQGDDAQGNPVASGIYFYKMRAAKYTSTRKMILMK